MLAGPASSGHHTALVIPLNGSYSGLKGEHMEFASYRPSRRTFLQAATAGVLAPAIAARSVAAAETELAADRISAAGLPAGFSIVDAHIHLWDLSRYPVPWIAGNPILNQSYTLH